MSLLCLNKLLYSFISFFYTYILYFEFAIIYVVTAEFYRDDEVEDYCHAKLVQNCKWGRKRKRLDETDNRQLCWAMEQHGVGLRAVSGPEVCLLPLWDNTSVLSQRCYSTTLLSHAQYPLLWFSINILSFSMGRLNYCLCEHGQLSVYFESCSLQTQLTLWAIYPSPGRM